MNERTYAITEKKSYVRFKEFVSLLQDYSVYKIKNTMLYKEHIPHPAQTEFPIINANA